MRKLLFPLFAFAAILLSGGCTHADGPSDALYGNWQLAGVEADGEGVLPSCAKSPKSWFVAFQASVVRIIHEEGIAEPLPCFGTFSRSPGRIATAFPDADQPVLWAEMGWGMSADFEIEKLTTDELVLTLADRSSAIRYKFRKW